MKKFKPLTSVLIKPSGPDCNLKCKYCFYLEKSKLFTETARHSMSIETLETVIKQLATQAAIPCSVNWQGGEPTLMGLSFYKQAAKLQKRFFRPNTYTNGFQTNGMLLTKEWADFFREENWLVGFSLDGPEEIHDTYRIDLGNKPTHAKLEAKIKMLLTNDVKVNVMCCVTSLSAKHPEKIYNYYKELGLHYMQFIPVVEPDKNNPDRAADFSVTDVAYGQFLKKIFDLWWADFRMGKTVTSIRDIESLFTTYVGKPVSDCVFNEECGNYVVIEHNGNVYSCDFFVEDQWKLGTVHTNKLIDMLNSEEQYTFGTIKRQLPDVCKQCRWYTKCYGGCPKDRIKDPQDMGYPRFCKSYKMFIIHADKYLSKLANQYNT